MFCAKCGNSLVDEAKFCNKCGEKTVVSESSFCSKCGNKLVDSAAFCNKCGAKSGGGDNVTIATATPTQPTKETEQLYKRGKECLDGGVIETAFKYFQEAAEQGHAGAQYELAAMYQYGEGVSESESHATKWYGMAAAQGHAEAQYNLALQYMVGEDTGVEEDITTAIKWLELSSNQGCGGAMCALGDLYVKGDGVPKDMLKAKELFIKAVDKGDFHAKIKLPALEFRILATEKSLLNDKNALLNAITDFFKQVTPLFEGQEDTKNIHIVNVSNDFDKKLKGALTYAQLQTDEIPLIIMDSTAFGNAKNGALFTTHALYAKDIASKAEIILFNDIKSLSFKKDGYFHNITVNGKKIGSLVRQPQNIVLLKNILRELMNAFKDLQEAV